MSSSAHDDRRPPWWLWLTRAGVVGVIAVTGQWLLQPPSPVCRQAVAETQVVQVCTPVELTDPRIGLALLVIALLLLPELSELHVLGVTIRRQVRQASEDAAVAKAEAAELRQQVTQMAFVSSSSSTQVHNIVLSAERAGATGATLVTAARGGSPVPVLDAEARAEELSQAAVIAFTAAMLGLGHSLPPWCERPAAVGFLLDDTGSFVATHNPLGVEDAVIDVAASMFDPADPDVTGLAVADDSWVCTAPAYSGGSLLGGLAVLFMAPDLDRAQASGFEPDDLRTEVTATTESLAAAYAQLLVDLLGEVPTGNEGGGPAQ